MKKYTTITLRLAFGKRCYRRLFVTSVVGTVACLAVLFWPMEVQPYLQTNASGEMLDRSGRLMYAFLNRDDQWCFPRELDAISPYLIQATIAAEDQRFYQHRGVDPLAVTRAAWQNVSERTVVSGASTITMQVVKRARGPSRSLWNKLCQAVQAVRLERRVTKDQILRSYLNGAPYGLNLVGCEAASRRYFGKSAKELSLSEAALLAAMPKAPSMFTPLKHPELALARRNYVLRRMRDEGAISQDEFGRATADPLGSAWHDHPTLAPHLAMRLRRNAGPDPARTTLDFDLQARAEQFVCEAVASFNGKVGNAAGIVVDVPTASVLARVGSANFDDAEHGGQVDACRAARSPGSALKPFTYALAIERNCLYSSETMWDSTLDYGQYQPVNFDGRYRGLVSASYALRQSLNVPAVAVLDRVGFENVYAFLKQVGFTTLKRPAAHYGLGLTIGNCEARLEELAAAYTMLASLGAYRPLRILEAATPVPAKDLLSRGTCLEIFAMLEQPLPSEWTRDTVQATGAPPRVCWKTGTSTGLRDAWAIVFNAQYLVAVWMGNNDGRPAPQLVGAKAALPLAARLFRSLEPRNGPSWPEPGEDLREATVCAVSGLPATQWCDRTREALLPRAQYLHRACDMHYPAGSGESGAVLERWPATAKAWNLAKIRTDSTRKSAGAKKASRERGLQITAPTNEAQYVLTGEREGDRIKLAASMDVQSALHWYLDERYLGASAPERPLYLSLQPGAHQLTCMTPAGLTDSARFDVVLPPARPVFSQ
ncbi:MAG: penicillin-binding protein 1C [Candidatus Hydrogenedentes bacterium]|nr:penicillin-binding protein 1C [Candidatus Hydrogenedentota bacterium]